jgi:Mrp family chromosome partitioning ATPase/uncharacterized protein involved in exopolysaccharide biosynthesis
MDLIRFIKVLLKRKKLLVFVPMLGMLAAFFLTRNTPDTFKSETTLSAGIIDDTKISLEENSVEKTSSYVIATKFSNLIQMIKSKSVIDLVSYELLLHDLKMERPYRQFNKNSFNIIQIDGTKVAETLRAKTVTLSSEPFEWKINISIKQLLINQKYSYEEIAKKLKVERVGDSDFIKMEFESENAHLSAFVLNKLSEVFISYYKNVIGKKTTGSVDFFKKLADEKKQELNQLVDKLKQFKLDNKIINLYEQTKSIVNQISELEIIRENENKKVPSLKKAVAEIYQRLSPEEKKYIEADYSVNSRVISGVKEKINSLSAKLIETGNKDLSLKDSLATLRKNLQSQVTKMSDNLILDPNATKQNLVEKKIGYELDLEIAKQSVQSNDKELKRLQRIVESYAPSEAAISSFEREISVAAEAYLVILNKLNLAKFAVEDLGKNIQQAESALAAEKAEPNKKVLIILLIGIISFVLTVVSIFILEYIDLTIQSPSRFKKFSGLCSIGDINQLNTKSVNVKEIFFRDSDDPSIVYFKNALRNFRYNISSLLNDNKIILVTSTTEKSGKSFIITTLAYSLSLLNKKVLVIDANFKNNSLTKQFDAGQSVSELFTGNENIFSIITKSSVAGVDVIGTGLTNHSPSEIIKKEKFCQVLNTLKQQYDYILIESPALNRNLDSKELIGYADHLLMVFSAKSILEPADKRSVDFVKESGKTFSTLLNRIEYENLEEIQGEVIKKRSAVRTYVKKLIKRNLGGKTNTKIEMSLG